MKKGINASQMRFFDDLIKTNHFLKHNKLSWMYNKESWKQNKRPGEAGISISDAYIFFTQPPNRARSFLAPGGRLY